MKITTTLSVVTLSLVSTLTFGAEIDTVYKRNDSKGFGGQITTANKMEVVVTQKVGNKEEHFPANEIARVEFQGEPASLALARSNLASGQLTEALAAFQEILGSVGSNQNLKGEIEYQIIRTLAKIAQADSTKVSTAVEKMNGFANAYRDHYRFYPVQQLLAETALLAKDVVTADSAFSRLQETPWPEYQMIGKTGMGRTLLAQDKVAEAKAIFDEVASGPAATPVEKACQMEAMLGQAKCLEEMDQLEPSAEVLRKIIDAAGPDDNRLLSQTYLQLGNTYSADGRHLKEAVLAYLHVDVIPSLAAQPDLHAEALYNLSKLWPAIGQPTRGAEASTKLQEEYPESDWTKKLADGQ
ncbi:tetratricopeptide repeat protein [Planctomicrobium sp. SH661]|uniref:tetratricopeptide repeat protein n=1 Tax=Planctomicrobium sp. SH661 TaxID=3448124 RepID=UPI003F5C8661